MNGRPAITIERAVRDDAPAMWALQQRAFAEEGRRVGTLAGGEPIPPLAETVDAIAGHIATQTALVARDGGRVVGAVRGLVSGPVCVVRALVVDPSAHGAGIGSRLLAALQAALPDVGRFDLTTNMAMAQNVPFYERRGWRVVRIDRLDGGIVLAQMSKPGGAADPQAPGA